MVSMGDDMKCRKEVVGGVWTFEFGFELAGMQLWEVVGSVCSVGSGHYGSALTEWTEWSEWSFCLQLGWVFAL